LDVIAGPGEFISDQPLQLNEWTTVIAERNRNDGSLIVNDAAAVKGPLSLYTDINPFYIIIVTIINSLSLLLLTRHVDSQRVLFSSVCYLCQTEVNCATCQSFCL